MKVKVKVIKPKPVTAEFPALYKYISKEGTGPFTVLAFDEHSGIVVESKNLERPVGHFDVDWCGFIANETLWRRVASVEELTVTVKAE